MKARIKFQAGAKLPPALAKPVVSKMNGTKWQNRQELIDFVDQQYCPPGATAYLLVICACGTSYPYLNKLDLPEGSVSCPCGRVVFDYAS